MKKFLILFIGVISMTTINAQDITDALRYSTDGSYGTARFRGMSGAFGALGGDLSALNVNPAGSAFFKRTHTSLSISNTDIENKTSYFGGQNSTSDSSFDLNQAGAAFVFENRNSNSQWNKFVFGIAYDQISNFDNEFFASGVNTNSIDSYFLNYAQGLRLDQISAFSGESYTEAYGDIGATYGFNNQQAFLGYESFILEPDTFDDDNTVYTSNIAPGIFNQEYSHVSTGYNGKLGVNAAMKYGENIYLGLNLNSHFINYDRSTYLFESNNNIGSIVQEVGFENNLSTTGNGFSFQLGGIAKLNENFRVGVSYQSPVWYTITDETTQYIATLRDDNGTLVTQVINPQIVNIFEEYKIQTPSSITGSAAIILGKQGLISFDYSRKDYSKAKFKPTTDSYFNSQNNIISNNLTTANTYRIGAELRHEKLSLRGGYKIEESPYKDDSFYGDLKGFSLGIGYNFGGTKLDLAYENAERDYNHQLYQTGLTDTTAINSKNSNIVLSLSFNL